VWLFVVSCCGRVSIRKTEALFQQPLGCGQQSLALCGWRKPRGDQGAQQFRVQRMGNQFRMLDACAAQQVRKVRAAPL